MEPFPLALASRTVQADPPGGPANIKAVLAKSRPYDLTCAGKARWSAPQVDFRDLFATAIGAPGSGTGRRRALWDPNNTCSRILERSCRPCLADRCLPPARCGGGLRTETKRRKRTRGTAGVDGRSAAGVGRWYDDRPRWPPIPRSKLGEWRRSAAHDGVAPRRLRTGDQRASKIEWYTCEQGSPWAGSMRDIPCPGGLLASGRRRAEEGVHSLPSLSLGAAGGRPRTGVASPNSI